MRRRASGQVGRGPPTAGLASLLFGACMASIVDEISLIAQDDGRWFDTATTSYGTGLQGMADRLSTQGRTLEVRSPGGGDSVTGRVPVGAVEVAG